MSIELKERIGTSAFAFRGYNVTNLGRSAELLAHPRYGPLVGQLLTEASALCAVATGRKVSLADRVRAGEPSTLESFAEDIALVVSIELAQIRLLKEFFGVDYARARLAYGYSLGELSALFASGVYQMADVLPAILAMAGECAELAKDVTMGIVFSRGAVLDFDAVSRLCRDINRQGNGVIAISAYLAPNTVLLLGQRDTVERFKKQMPEALPGQTYLRTNHHRWPPLHTPLLWERNIPNRAALQMHTVPGGSIAPEPPVLSLVAAKTTYNDYNSRELLNRWIDQPQRLWDAVYETLVAGVDVVIHVGPEPNLIPATFKRLSDNVKAQLSGWTASSIGLRAMSGMARRPWLSKLLSSRTALLRAPFVEHVILEDWLLEQPTK